MPMPLTPKTDLIEIFSSIQGEGLLVGCRQIFFRFPGCNLDCHYCDTNFAKTDVCKVEECPGSNQMVDWVNPVSIDQVQALIRKWKDNFPAAHHSISVTGGEPLLHAETLSHWLPQLRAELPIYLETNGTLPDQLESLIDQIDWISMDVKLHSLSGERTDWDIHRRFLEIANRVQSYVKIVVGQNTPDLELQLAGDLVEGVAKHIPLIIQPVTIDNKVAVSTDRLLHMQAVVADTHRNVRVIPQTHNFLGLL